MSGQCASVGVWAVPGTSLLLSMFLGIFCVYPLHSSDSYGKRRLISLFYSSSIDIEICKYIALVEYFNIIFHARNCRTNCSSNLLFWTEVN